MPSERVAVEGEVVAEQTVLQGGLSKVLRNGHSITSTKDNKLEVQSGNHLKSD